MTTRTIREAARLRVEALYTVPSVRLKTGPLVTIGQIAGNGPWSVAFSAIQEAPTVLRQPAAFYGVAKFERRPDGSGFKPMGDSPVAWLSARTSQDNPVNVDRLPIAVLAGIRDIIAGELARLERNAQQRKGGI